MSACWRESRCIPPYIIWTDTIWSVKFQVQCMCCSLDARKHGKHGQSMPWLYLSKCFDFLGHGTGLGNVAEFQWTTTDYSTQYQASKNNNPFFAKQPIRTSILLKDIINGSVVKTDLLTSQVAIFQWRPRAKAAGNSNNSQAWVFQRSDGSL